MCEIRVLEIMSSDDDDEEGEHKVLNLFLEVVEQSSMGMLVKKDSRAVTKAKSHLH